MTNNQAIARMRILISDIKHKVYKDSKEIHGVPTVIVEYIEAAVYTALNSQSHNEGD